MEATKRRTHSSRVALLILLAFGTLGPAEGRADSRAGRKEECLPLFRPEKSNDTPGVGLLIDTFVQSLRQRLILNRDAFLFEPVEDYPYIWDELKTEFPLLRSVVTELDRIVLEHTPYSKALEDELLRKVHDLVHKPQHSERQDQAALLALGELQMLRRQSDALAEAAATAKAENPPPPEKAPPKEKKKKEKSPPQKPKYPDPDETYRAKTKPFPDGGEGSGDEKVSIAYVNEPGIVYFKKATFGVIDARTGVWSISPISSVPAPKLPNRVTDYRKLTVMPFDKKGADLPILLPEGYVPISQNADGSRAWRAEDGNYYFNTDQEKYEIILVPQKSVARPLNPQEIRVYTQKSGIATDEWPEKIRLVIAKIREMRTRGEIPNRGANIQIASLVTEVIRRGFLYSMDAVDSVGAVAMANAGAFQCDGAATIMASILREEFGIPVRICGGFQGSRHGSIHGQSHVVLPGIGHAWVEVADETGEWHTFDPTPTKKTRPEKKSAGEANPWKPNTKKNDDPEPEESEPPGGAPGEPAESGESVADMIEEMKKRQAEEAGTETGAKKGSEEEAQTPEGESAPHEEDAAKLKGGLPTSAVDEILKTLESTSPLSRAFVHQVMRWVLDPRISGAMKLDRIEKVRAAALGSAARSAASIFNLSEILNEAKLLFGKSRPAFPSWSVSIANQAARSPLSTTADELMDLKRQLEFSLRFAGAEDSRWMSASLDRVNRARAALASVRDPNATQIQIARELFKDLPGSISKRILRERFAISGDLGDDVGTLALAEAIGQGELEDFRTMSILGPFTNFVTDPIYRPARGSAKTWERTFQRQPGRPEILMSQDLRDKEDWISFAPQLSDEEAFRRGLVGVIGQRKRVPIPKGREGIDPEMATIILYDTSGSMAGASAEFQSHYIGAIVDRALSDTDRSGRIRHRVYLSGFDTQVHSAVEITTREQALSVVKDLRNRTKNTAGGTDIQTALLDGGVNLIAEAKRTGDRTLERANVVLLSDGGSEVDLAVVSEAYRKVKGTSTQVTISFVAIRETNPILRKLAQSSGKLGVEKSNYFFWSSADMNKVATTAKAPPVATNDFWSSKSFQDLSRSAQSSILDLSRGAEIMPPSPETYASIRRLERKIEESRRAPGGGEDSVLMFQVENLRSTIDLVSMHMASSERTRLLDHILAASHAGVTDLDRPYSIKEIAVLTHLLRWAKGEP